MLMISGKLRLLIANIALLIFGEQLAFYIEKIWPLPLHLGNHFSIDFLWNLFPKIDFFKKFNDTYGHDIGDKVISSIANHIKTVIGSYGIVGRYGGDEFIVILEHCSPNYCKNIIDKLSVLDHINNLFSLEKPLSLSGGFMHYDGTITIDECLALVDNKLYQAKHKGRNQIIID